MTDTSALAIQNVSVSIGSRTLLHNISLDVKSGECCGIVGPNGSGKSTLLKTLLGYLRPSQGTISIGGRSLQHMSALERSRKMAYVQQEGTSMQGFKVRSFLELAFHPLTGIQDHGEWLAECEGLCQEFQLKDKLDLSLSVLSGGERQRLMLVQSLLQKPHILLLDELTNHLDIYFQLEILKKLKEIPQTKLMVLHDLNLAARFCDQVLLLQDGRKFGSGEPSAVLNEDSILRLFGVKSQIHRQAAGISHIQWG